MVAFIAVLHGWVDLGSCEVLCVNMMMCSKKHPLMNTINLTAHAHKHIKEVLLASFID